MEPASHNRFLLFRGRLRRRPEHRIHALPDRIALRGDEIPEDRGKQNIDTELPDRAGDPAMVERSGPARSGTWQKN